MACNILDGTDCDACLTGTVITRERVYTNGTKHHEVRCDTCNKFYGHRKLECELIMPFGKYKGKTLETIYKEFQGKEYLEWLASQDTKYGKRVKEWLENY